MAYASVKWLPGSPIFDRARASGLSVLNWQDAIMVNMLGQRFYDETGLGFTSNDYNSIKPYSQGSYLNAAKVAFKPNNWINAAMAGIGDGHNGGGPIWAVFDTDAVTRENWVPMPPDNLEQTVARYNSFIDSGTDYDFGKPKPLHKIATPPFHAAWATPVIHDTRAGLRINANCQVIDMNGQVIPGLYCGGESAGGFSLHGLARATCQGYIAGHHAVLA